jgi:transaldolase
MVNGIQIFLDSGSLEEMEKYVSSPEIEGFTTNPSLLRKSGVMDYRAFSKRVLEIVGKKEVSFEVIADDLDGMGRQAREIASWGRNVWVKIPITNTAGDSTIGLVKTLKNVNVNLTAVFTNKQIDEARHALKPKDILSVFAGRINDTMRREPTFSYRTFRTLYASTRHVFAIQQAKQSGYDIITMTPDLVAKLSLTGKDLNQYSLETVQMFNRDSQGIVL